MRHDGRTVRTTSRALAILLSLALAGCGTSTGTTFRNFTHANGEVTDWWSNPDDGNQVAFGRGDSGFVVINRAQDELEQTLPTSLAPGIYCDVTTGDLLAAGGCSGEAVEVAADGSITVDVPPMRALAIHIGARLP